ncbi:hypothetical protein LINPERHAP2_LOCUS41798, partial [Linum perenne]
MTPISSGGYLSFSADLSPIHCDLGFFPDLVSWLRRLVHGGCGRSTADDGCERRTAAGMWSVVGGGGGGGWWVWRRRRRRLVAEGGGE